MSWRVGAAVVAVVVIVAGAAFFEPWRLFTSSRVDEALPTVSPTSDGPGGTRSPDVAAPAEKTAPHEPVQLARGEFEDA